MSYDLELLERLEREATPAEWILDWDWFGSGDSYTANTYTPTVHGGNLTEIAEKSSHDRLFVEALRNAAPAMFADLRRLKAENEQAQKAPKVLGLALVDHEHQWTDEERTLYEEATAHDDS